MPNLVLEYSNSVEERVNVQGLLEDLHKAALESGLFELASVKSRTLRCHNWLIGEAGDSSILSISILICCLAERLNKSENYREL